MNGMKNYLSHGGETELDNCIQVYRAKVNLPGFCAWHNVCSHTTNSVQASDTELQTTIRTRVTCFSCS